MPSSVLTRATVSPEMARSRSLAAISLVIISPSAVESQATSGRPESLRGGQATKVNWLRLDLGATTFAVFVSTDGQTWQQLGTLARRPAFADAPAELILGHGDLADGPRESYTIDTLFANLITVALP